MIRRLVSLLARPLLPLASWIARSPRVRYHPLLTALRHSPHEEMLEQAMYFARTSRLEGDYLEFGVYQGSSLISAYHGAMRRGLDMRFYGFDSFHGLPVPNGIDTQGFEHFSAGQYSCSQDDVRRRLKAACVDLDRVELVPGYYNEVLDKAKQALPIRKAAVVVIDCDLYESTVSALDFLTDYVQDGTLLIFDDWFAYRGDPDRGEQRAFREWLSRNEDISATVYRPFAVCGMSFILSVS